MNTFQKMLVGVCIIAAPFLGSCGKDDPDPCNYLTESQQEYDALITASNAWAADPSNTAKCNAYKSAYQAYLNELDSHNNCVPVGQEAAYQQAIDDAQASINQLQC